MKCHECGGLFYEYLDNELDDATRQKVEQHLAECQVCQTEWQATKESLALYHSHVTAVGPSYDIAERVVANLPEREYRLFPEAFLFIGAFMVVLFVAGAFTLLPVVYPILRVGVDLAVNLLPIPAIMLMAFPAAKMGSLMLLGLALLIMTWATRRAILY
jgi:anti-sigma factor RsiW